MGFNSFLFLGFFALVLLCNNALRRHHAWQNRMLLAASYAFYATWDWRFAFLLLLTTSIDYTIARLLGREDRPARRKWLLGSSIAANLGILGFFKYFGFFTDSLAALLCHLGLQVSPLALHIVLPVGISFYTFQTLSYTVDVYRGKLEPRSHFLDFALYLSFFPQLVAGPIERASTLLPQIERPRIVTRAAIDAGVYLILWGYFKKLVIADNLSAIVEPGFSAPDSVKGFAVVLLLFGFSVQIYCDFSGYTDIARGVAKLLGFELMLNFKLPYFALNPQDFWNRWHISLSSWLRDYLYIPLGGNRHGQIATYRNLIATMVLGGLWHGAAWHFVAWGLFHGMLLAVHRGYRSLRGPSPDPGAFGATWRMAAMFTCTMLGWTLFRVHTLGDAITLMRGLIEPSHLPMLKPALDIAFFTLPLLIVQVAQHWSRDLLVVQRLPFWGRAPITAFLGLWLLVFAERETSQFIYFQF
ncbi:MAG: MBOAT family protein [Myxococcota bacterium]|jgi:D-alanyl-lipoteichoic acid acyltransferase DltB (MBOAT superfamily)|nr:MBOAT family protein [Myxococcota bacterium]